MEIQLYKTKGLTALITFLFKRFNKKTSRSISILTGLMCVCVLGFSQTTSLSFTQIPTTDPEIVRPGGGAEQWTARQNIVNIPTQGTNTTRLDAYYRFQWSDIQPTNAPSPGQGMDFSKFDAEINDAINKGQGFNFGIMPNCCSGPSVGGAQIVYPVALHNAMQAESVKDWNNSGGWYENPNSPSWLTWFKALHQALYNHIQTASFNGVPYKNVVKRIDVRIMGDFGEQAVLGGGPKPTDAATIALVDAVVQSYPDIKCVAMVGSFGANTGVGISSAAVGYYELTTSNKAGLLGWRWDSWGWTDGYMHSWLENNPNVVNGFRFDTAIMNRYKYGPVCGEPADLGAAGNFDDLPVRVKQYHAESFGNGNLDNNNPPNTTIQNNFRAASKAAGYRLILTGGSMTSTLSAGSSFNLTLNWQNIGLAPTYENWNVTYELRNSGNAVVWSGTSTFNPRLFSPAASAQAISDNFTLAASVPQGTYSMYLIIKDPNAYRKPLPLAITGRGTDGSYLLRSNITVGTGGPTNQTPVANAGADQTIQLPASSVSLTGSATDADGSIASYAWTQQSGPAGATITTPTTSNSTVTGLVQGVYVFTLTSTDNQGGKGTDNVQITVNAAAANKLPVANAGADQTIQLPASSVSLTGSGTDPDGSVASYAWTQQSGPAGATITTPATANTTITGLAQGVYVFTCTVTDNQGGKGTDNVQITVNAVAANQPPVANAGADQTIQLPASSVSLTGSGTDADGSIASYAWTQQSGPAGATITTPATSNTSITGLVQGVYVFTLTTTDNKGGNGTDNVQITVNASSNKPPVANAGADQTIQAPASSVALTGSGTDTDGSIASYAWTQSSGPAGATITTANSPNTTITGLAQGVYVFTCTVTDNQGSKGTDNVQITVNASAANQQPVADAGSDMNITLPTNTVNVNGSGSKDPNGTISSYTWTKVTGPSAFTIANSSAMSTSITNLAAGVYAFQLKVMDNAGAIAMDTLKVTVNPAAPANQPPVANAGADQNITLPINSVTINGNASSDPDGSVTGYVWSKISGPAQFSLGNSGTASTLLSNLAAGVYTFQLKVTDNSGATALDTIKIIVNAAPVNQPPVANAGADISITLPANTVNLNGSASSDADGSVSGYTWSQISGPNTASITSVVNSTTGVTSLQQGVYVFALTVVDNNGASNLDSVKVTVNQPANQPPVANAGSSKSITLPVNSISLNGSLSSDPDGNISSYTWSQTAGPSTSGISNGNTSIATATNLVAGVYTFQLTVTDNNGASSNASVKITVTAAGIQPPVANAGADKTITLPANSVIIDGSGSSASSGNSIVSYTWTEKSGPSAVTLTNTAQNTLNNLQAGKYVFMLSVTDNNSATGMDSVTITVNPAANKAPVANAGSSINLTLPKNSANLDGTKSADPDGTITNYAWTRISGPNTPTLSGLNTATLSVSGMIAGQYTYQLTVTDNSGASSSAQVKIRVSSASNLPPVANAGPNQSITAPANTVNLDGSASSDADGTLSSYSWTSVSGPGAATINNSNTAKPSVTGLQTGGYVFELTVTDNSGAVSKDQVSITVQAQAIAPNQAPVANAGTDQTITLPVSSVTLDGKNSFDPDGTLTGFSWKQISGPSTATITPSNVSLTTVSKLGAGQYVFELTVTDNTGTTNTDRVSITVSASAARLNMPPVAISGASDTISLPTSTYTLDATQSIDPDGTISSYQWQEISGPNTITSSSMSGAKVDVSNLQAGEYEFRLTVTDNSGASSNSSMKLTVEPGIVSHNPAQMNRLSVYPNPAHSVINQRITSNITGTVQINIYNMDGKLVYTGQQQKTSDVLYNKIVVSQLAPGMYTIQVNIANQKTLVSKFIKY